MQEFVSYMQDNGDGPRKDRRIDGRFYDLGAVP